MVEMRRARAPRRPRPKTTDLDEKTERSGAIVCLRVCGVDEGLKGRGTEVGLWRKEEEDKEGWTTKNEGQNKRENAKEEEK